MDDEVHQGSSILLNFVLMYVRMVFIILVRGIYSVTKSCNTHTHGHTKSHIEVWNPPGTPPKKSNNRKLSVLFDLTLFK